MLALFDPHHVHHARALGWWSGYQSNGWASCPLTENGFIRVASGSGYPNPIPLREAISAFHRQISLSDHRFWSDDVSIADAGVFNHPWILGPRQITDIYLLALSVKNGGGLVTFDRRIPLAAVRGAEPRHLLVI